MIAGLNFDFAMIQSLNRCIIVSVTCWHCKTPVLSDVMSAEGQSSSEGSSMSSGGSDSSEEDSVLSGGERDKRMVREKGKRGKSSMWW